jgi:RES domain-containing protein
VIVYRICQAAYAGTAAEMIAGTGGLHSAGRWHTAGKRIVYLSQNLSLAAHEISVHYPRRKHALKFAMSRIDIPDHVVLTLQTFGVKALPAGWDSQPPGSATQVIGDNWLAAKVSAALEVPSVIIPGEFNYLLNPEHADFRLVKAESPTAFSFDPRL